MPSIWNSQPFIRAISSKLRRRIISRKHIVAVEGSECEMGKCFRRPRASKFSLERLVEGNVVRMLVRRDVGDDLVVSGDQVVEPRLDGVTRMGIFSKRRKRTQPDPRIGASPQRAHDDV